MSLSPSSPEFSLFGSFYPLIEFEKLRKLFGVMTPNFIKIADNKFTEILEYVKRLFKVKEHALAQVVLTEAFSVSRSVSRMDPKLLSELLNLLSCCLR